MPDSYKSIFRDPVLIALFDLMNNVTVVGRREKNQSITIEVHLQLSLAIQNLSKYQ